MAEAQASVQAVFDELIHSAGYLFSDLTAFLRQRKTRTVLICAANDVDGTCAAHILQHFLIDVLGLFVRVTFLNHYSDLALLAVHYDGAAWICINCCARQYVPDILQNITRTNLENVLFCLIDQNRPLDQKYIVQAMHELNRNGPGSSRVHIYLTEDDYKATKLAVFDSQVAHLFRFDVQVPAMSRLTQSLIIDINGEYSADNASLIALAAISEHQADTAVDVLACSVALASDLSRGLLSVSRYSELIERLKKFHKLDQCSSITHSTELQLPMLRLQPLSATLKTAILQLGDTLTIEPADLNAIRTELELTTKQWDELPSPDILVDHRDKIVSVLKRYVVSGNGHLEIPIMALKTSAGILNNLDLGVVFGYNLINPLTARSNVNRASEDEEGLGALRARTDSLVISNASALEVLETLSWLGRPSTPRRKLESMFANARQAQEDSVRVIGRLMLHRKGSVFGLRGTLEGFLEENSPECLLDDYALTRISFALSRLITKDGEEEQLAHVLLTMSSERSAGLIKGYLAYADHTRTNRLGLGLTEVLKDRLGADTFEQDFVNASLVCVTSDIARKSFHSLFPRKRVRCNSFQPDDEQPRDKRNRRSSS